MSRRPRSPAGEAAAADSAFAGAPGALQQRRHLLAKDQAGVAAAQPGHRLLERLDQVTHHVEAAAAVDLRERMPVEAVDRGLAGRERGALGLLLHLRAEDLEAALLVAARHGVEDAAVRRDGGH